VRKQLLAFFLSILCLLSQSGLPVIIAHCHQSDTYSIRLDSHHRCKPCCGKSKMKLPADQQQWEKAPCCEWSKQYLKCDNSFQQDTQLKIFPAVLLSSVFCQKNPTAVTLCPVNRSGGLYSKKSHRHQAAFLAVFRC
jgi:hypothetical protein